MANLRGWRLAVILTRWVAKVALRITRLQVPSIISPTTSLKFIVHFACCQPWPRWGIGSAVERRRLSGPLGGLRTEEGGKSGVMSEGLFQPIHLLMIPFLVVLGFVVLIPYWQIFKKAGFSPWLSLLIVVPFVNLCALYYLAFARWPDKSK
jgi:hypothetical protein